MRRQDSSRSNPRSSNSINQSRGASFQLSAGAESRGISANKRGGPGGSSGSLRNSSNPKGRSGGNQISAGNSGSRFQRVVQFIRRYRALAVIGLSLVLFLIYYSASYFTTQVIQDKLELEKQVSLLKNNNKELLRKLDKEKRRSAFSTEQAVVGDYIQFVNPSLTRESAEEIVNNVYRQALIYRNVPPALILFVIEIESTFDFTAVNKKSGTLGGMQVNPKVWIHDPDNSHSLRNIGIKSNDQLMDVENNIRGGAYILNHYMDQCMEIDEDIGMPAAGYESTFECTALKYFGGKYRWYYKRLKETAGKYWFFITANTPVELEPMTIEPEAVKIKADPDPFEPSGIEFGNNREKSEDDVIRLGDPLNFNK